MLKNKSLLSIASAGVALMAISGYASAETQVSSSDSSATEQAQHQGQHKKRQFNNQALLALLNIDASTLQQDLKAGQSFADIATSAGSSEQAVIDLLTKQSTQRIDQAVSAGKMTQDQADQMKAELPDRIKNQVENKGGFAGKGNGGRHGGQFKVVASFLGVDQQQLMTQLKGGQSLADIATAQGKTEQDLIDQLVSTSKQRIDQAVTAGKLTQDKATQMESNLPDQVKKEVERKGDFGGDHRGGFNGGGQFKEIATLLEVQPQNIMTQLKAGQSLVDIAATKNVTEQQLIDQLVSSATQHINQEVTSGKITQDQADQNIAKLQDRFKQMVEQKGFTHKQGSQHHWYKDGSSTTTSNNQLDSTNKQ